MHAITFIVKRAHLRTVAFGQRLLQEVVPEMTPARFDLMYLLRRLAIVHDYHPLGSGRSQAGLARDLGLHPTTVGKMVKRLVEMGWVRRVKWMSRRDYSVGLTESGLEIIRKAMKHVFRRKPIRGRLRAALSPGDSAPARPSRSAATLPAEEGARSDLRAVPGMVAPAQRSPAAAAAPRPARARPDRQRRAQRGPDK